MEQQVSGIQPYISPKSGLVAHEKQWVATKGYRTDALIQWLSMAENVEKWITLDSLVKLFDARISEAGRRSMRRKLCTAYVDLRERGYLLLKGKNEAGQIVQVKLCDPTKESDQEFARQQLEAAQENNEESKENLETAAKLAGIQLLWDLPEYPND